MRTEELATYVNDLGGIATSAQLKQAGFSPGIIEYALKSGLIDKMTRGVYCGTDVLEDDFAAVCLRWKKAVLSHGSALYLLGLSDRVPTALDVTVPHGYNPQSLGTEYLGIRVHRVSAGLYDLGIIDIRTPAGNLARAYDAERSVADLIKARSKGSVDAQIVRDAVGGYFGSEGRDLVRLAQMCEAVGVRRELQVYLEVLT